MPNFSYRFLVDVDDSGRDLNVVLAHIIEGEEHVIVYAIQMLIRLNLEGMAIQIGYESQYLFSSSTIFTLS